LRIPQAETVARDGEVLFWKPGQFCQDRAGDFVAEKAGVPGLFRFFDPTPTPEPKNMKLIIASLALALVALSLGACKSKQQQTAYPAPAPVAPVK
jgi:hypothetical protein